MCIRDSSDRGTGLHRGGVDGGTESGGDPAADQGGYVEGHVLGHRHRAPGVDDDLLGEGASTGEAEDIAAGALEVGGARVHEPGQAQLGLAALAGGAGAAGGQPAHDDPVAGLQVAYALADFDDLARALVTGHEGHRLGQYAAHRGQVRVAQAGGPHPDPHPAGPEAHRLDIVEDLQLVLAGLVQYGCAHGAAPLGDELNGPRTRTYGSDLGSDAGLRRGGRRCR